MKREKVYDVQMKRGEETGLTLVETIAVAGLISLIVLFTLGLIPSFKVSNRRANMELQAGNLAQSTLEEQRARPFDLVVSSGPTSTPIDGVPYELEVVVSPGASANSKRVRTQVQWQWKERNYQTFRETIVCRVPRS